MIIYGSTMSPFVRKAVAFANEKGIDFTLKQLGLGANDPDFLAASPFKKIPALTDGDYKLADSSAIIHYIEALHPEPALIPADPRERGKTIWWDEFADTIVAAAGGKMFFNRIVAPRFLGRDGDLAAADKAQAEEVPPILAWLETQIPASGYLVGDRLTLADIAVASPFVNFTHAGCPVDGTLYPKLCGYLAGILARPSFARMVAAETKMLAA